MASSSLRIAAAFARLACAVCACATFGVAACASRAPQDEWAFRTRSTPPTPYASFDEDSARGDASTPPPVLPPLAAASPSEIFRLYMAALGHATLLDEIVEFVNKDDRARFERMHATQREVALDELQSHALRDAVVRHETIRGDEALLDVEGKSASAVGKDSRVRGLVLLVRERTGWKFVRASWDSQD